MSTPLMVRSMKLTASQRPDSRNGSDPAFDSAESMANPESSRDSSRSWSLGRCTDRQSWLYLSVETKTVIRNHRTQGLEFRPDREAIM